MKINSLISRPPLFPYFYFEDGMRVESYAEMEMQEDRFVLNITRNAVKRILKAEDKSPGALLQSITLLHNFFFLFNPISPTAITNIRMVPEGPHKWRATISYAVEER